MQRRHLAVLFLMIFCQAVIYPAALFAVYVDHGDSITQKSLPADFPDNGNAFFFGFSNNEEEEHPDKGLFESDEFVHGMTFLPEVIAGSYSDLPTGQRGFSHFKNCTPPPEQV